MGGVCLDALNQVYLSLVSDTLNLMNWYLYCMLYAIPINFTCMSSVIILVNKLVQWTDSIHVAPLHGLTPMNYKWGDLSMQYLKN